MNKEEILAKSKQENHGQDIANLEISKAGMQIGWMVIICLLAIVTVVDALVSGRMNNEVFFSVLTGCSAVFLFKYLKLRSRQELIVSIIYGFAALAFLIAWVLQLA